MGYPYSNNFSQMSIYNNGRLRIMSLTISIHVDVFIEIIFKNVYLAILTINFVNCAPVDSAASDAVEYKMGTEEIDSNSDDQIDSPKWKSSVQKTSANKREYPTEGILLGKREYPTEGILLGKREYPTEGILLGKREYPTEGFLLGKREYPTEGILLGKREYPTEGILLGKREYPTEGILLGKREYPTEGILLGKRQHPTEGISFSKEEYPTEGIILGKRNFRFFAPKSSGIANHAFNN
jgi:hypothetical protein